MLCVEFRCHIVCVMLTKVGGEKCSGEQGHVVCGCCNVCMCLAGSWGREWCKSGCMGGGVGLFVGGEWVQVLMEKRWYLPRYCGCGV